MRDALFLSLFFIVSMAVSLSCTTPVVAEDKARAPSTLGRSAEGTSKPVVTPTARSLPTAHPTNTPQQKDPTVAPDEKENKGEGNKVEVSESTAPRNAPPPPGRLRVLVTN